MREISILWVLATVTAALNATPAWAQSEPDAEAYEPFAVNVYWENDAVGFKFFDSTDRYYTNGAGFSVAWEPSFAEAVTALIPWGETDRSVFGFTVAQHIYTPRETQIAVPQPQSRPWAGYLYTGAFVERIHENTMDHFQLDVGMVGPAALADRAQKAVHDVLDLNEPKGWDNQLRDEPTVQFTFRKKWALDMGGFEAGSTPVDMQIIPQVGFGVGTVKRQIEGGATFRIGYQLPDDFGPSGLNDIGPPAGTRQTGWSIYGFGRVGGKAVEHDIFLDGNNYRHSASITKKPLIADFQLGLALAYHLEALAIELSYSQTYRTVAFEGQDGMHGFGAWTLNFIWEW